MSKRWRLGKWSTLAWVILLAALQTLTACAVHRVQGNNVSDSSVKVPDPTSTAIPAVVESPARLATPTPTRVAPPTAAPTAVPSPTGSPSTVPASVAIQLGLIIPVKGAHVPEWLNLVPGAPRAYRSGVHEGVDFGFNAVGVTVRVGTPVLAAGDGVVIRADVAYREPPPEEMERILRESRDRGYTSPFDLDKLRGLQLWIDHGQGVVTRYAHLDRIAPGIVVGSPAFRGQMIAYAGTSGDPDEGPAEQPHLHFEVRLGDSYLGEGLSPAKARELYVQTLGSSNR